MDTLNDMLNAWIDSGLDLEFIEFTDLDDVIPYPQDHMAAMRYNLAIELAPEYGVKISQSVAVRAAAYYRGLLSQYENIDTLTVDDGLKTVYNPNSAWRL